MISIKGLNKAEVLKSLYDHSHVQGMGFLQAVPEGYVTVEHCEELLARTTYFDYLYGKVLKVDLSGDEFDEHLYDRDCGLGMAQRAVDAVRKGVKKKSTSGVFVMSMNKDFQVSLDHFGNEVAFKVYGRKPLEELIHVANQLLEEQEKLTMEQEAKAERQKIEAEAAAEVARINADAALYAGEKEAEINEMISKSVTDALVEYLKIEQWDGKLPSVTGADSIVTMGG